MEEIILDDCEATGMKAIIFKSDVEVLRQKMVLGCLAKAKKFKCTFFSPVSVK